MEIQRDFYVGMVEDNIDPNRKGRIKVRVQSLYHDLDVKDIPYAYPFAGLAGKEFQVPAIGKLVNILYLSDDLYSPYYIYSENYNVNLQSKLKDISASEYPNWIALLFDERTQIFADSKELTIDHLYNKITINNDSINLELKDNTQIITLGSTNANQDAVLGTNFFAWLDKFINELSDPFALTGNLNAPVLRPKLDKLCAEYKKLRSPQSENRFTSDNVKIVDNKKVAKLERSPETVYKKNDTDLVMSIEDTQDCTAYKQIEAKEKQNLDASVGKQNDKACKDSKTTAPTTYVKPSSDMIIPLMGDRISSRFGLRPNPTDPTSPKLQGHGAIDIAAAIGTSIVSPADGTVISTGFDSTYGGGNYIRIKHTNGFTTGYAHLSAILVQVNQKVKQGDQIGLVGNSGGHTTGPHLHFTVTTPANVKVDPEYYFTWPPRPGDVKENNLMVANNQYQGQNYQTPVNGCLDQQQSDYEKDPDPSAAPMSTSFDNANFLEMTKKVVYNLEGGYFSQDMLYDGRVNDKRYKGSGETMYGIDRSHFSQKNTPAYKKFWKIIDDADARSTWKYNYYGGSLSTDLMSLTAEMIKPVFDDFCNRYLSPQSIAIINSDNLLLFNFIYATWNGEGWFQKFSKPFNQAVERGITDITVLRQIAVDARINESNSLIVQTGRKIQKLFATNLA